MHRFVCTTTTSDELWSESSRFETRDAHNAHTMDKAKEVCTKLCVPSFANFGLDTPLLEFCCDSNRLSLDPSGVVLLPVKKGLSSSSSIRLGNC